MLRSRWRVLFATATAAAIAAGCSDGSDGSPAGSDGNGGNQAGSQDASTSGGDASALSDGASQDSGSSGDAGNTTTFSYHPQWPGVTEVDVIGAFGTSDDWDPKAPFLKLTNDGSGNYTGGASLAAGSYLFLFHVIGDSAQSDPAFDRYAIDPLDPDVEACPSDAPTGGRSDPPNPCSQVTVGTPAAAPIHLRGTLTVDGATAVGWLAVVARQDNGTHHFFVNRMTIGGDGKYDLIASAGRYKIEVDLPDSLTVNDIDRDPLALNTVRGAKSGPMQLTTDDVDMETPDLAYHDYGSFAPSDGNGGTLPTMFTFVKGRAASLDVYGGKGDGGVVETGDPWFESDATNKGKFTFDGNFSKGDTDAAVPGTRYMWGTEEPYDASVPWTVQSLVFPVTWH
ncbi:MAG: hypothetical protein ACRELY_07075 [Polyangiaceae bacterium]